MSTDKPTIIIMDDIGIGKKIADRLQGKAEVIVVTPDEVTDGGHILEYKMPRINRNNRLGLGMGAAMMAASWALLPPTPIHLTPEERPWFKRKKGRS